MTVTQHALTTYEAMKANLLAHIRSLFPVEGKTSRLDVEGLDVVDGLDEGDYAGQKAARLEGRSWSTPVVARLVLRRDGRIIDRAKIKIIDLPKLTNRGSYIVGGSEYMFPLQKRLRSGTYVRFGQDEELRTFFNLAKGRNFHLGIHPVKGHFQFQVDTSLNIPLYPLLQALGVTDEAMVAAWGREAFAQNRVSDPATRTRALNAVYTKMSHGQEPVPPPDEIATAVRGLFAETKMDGDNVALSLGQKIDTVTGRALLLASGKMLKVGRGEEPEDNRDSLIHNHIVDLSDYLVERFKDPQFRGRITRTIKFNIDRRDKIAQIISRDSFQRPVDSMFTEAELSQSPTQSNPLGMIGDYTLVTVRGEGGVTDKQITRNIRALDPSHLGFLDPSHTPEGQSVGTTLHLTTATRKSGNELVTRVWDVRAGKATEISPTRLWTATVAFSESLKDGKLVGRRVKATNRGRIEVVPASKVDYAFIAPEHMLDVNTANIPFVSHDNGTRVMMASKLSAQAKSLADGDVPMVQSRVATEKETVERAVGEAFAPKSPVAGVVEAIGDDYVTISGTKVPIPNYFPLNSNNFVHARVTVKVGDKIKKGQVIADTNYVKDGQLALGKNLLVAYVPYKGLNVEDGVVVSRAAAGKLTSEHLYQLPHLFDAETIRDLKKYRAYFPAKLTDAQARNLDDQGVVKKGSVVAPGAPLVVAMRPRPMGTESQRLARISRILAREFVDHTLTWGKDVEGVVEEVGTRANEIVVYVRTREPARVGDKLVGRHGNKGVIAYIVDDSEMPKDAKGRTLDLLLNPNGVVSRMNLGQILETTASKVAEKTGKPYLAQGFGGDSANKVLKELKSLGLKDHETIHDPVDNVDIPGVLVGHQHVYKLEHMATKKMSARGGGVDEEYSGEGQPTRGPHGGRAIGTMELYALLAHGALNNLHEMYGVKSGFDPEVWRAIESGAPLPPPRPSYAQERFRATLKGMGVQMVEGRNSVALVPFLDRDVKKVSAGEITDYKLLRAKDLREEPGGLFDPKKTGGVQGDRWSHIRLPEPLPNPTFEKAIVSLLHLTSDEYQEIVSGQKTVRGLTGGKAVKAALEDIDVKKRVREITAQIVGKSGAELNALHRELRFLKALDARGISPSEYVIDLVPVLPPKFRPVYTMADGNLKVSDVNFHYASALQIADQLKSMKGREFGEQRRTLNTQLYKALGGIMGVDEGVVERTPAPKGLAMTLAGVGTPKAGYVHQHLLKRRQDVSATIVAVPDPRLGMDEIGLPEAMAWKTFRPFVVRELKTLGLTPLAARKAIDDRQPLAAKALERVMSERHVLMNRAPSLHKFSIMALKPRLVTGHAMKMSPLIVGGLNADFDGDEVLAKIFVYIPESIVQTLDHERQWWDQRRVGGEMAARFGVSTVMFGDGNFYLIDMEEFPHGPLVEQANGIDAHAVEKGIQVLAMNESGHVELADVSLWTFHRQKEIVIVNLGGDRQTMTDDDPRAVFGIDPKTMVYGRWRPAEAVGKMVPMVRNIDIPTTFTELGIPELEDEEKIVKTDRDSGWFFGAMVGNGWSEHVDDKPVRVCFASTYEDVQKKWSETSSLFFDERHVGRREHERLSIDGVMRSMTALVISRTKFAKFVSELVGRGAENKHLPPFTLSAPADFRLGLIEGLLDTDGSCSWNRSRKKPQFLCSYSTSSSRLAREVVLLCRSLGISASITAYQPPAGRQRAYLVSLSSPDIHKLDLRLTRAHKREALAEFKNGPCAIAKGRSVELVPIGGKASLMAMDLCRRHGDNATYTTCAQAKTKGYVSRAAGKKIVAYAEKEAALPDEFLHFRDLVANENVSWLPVLGFEATGIVEDGYDLTVPGYETFMSVDGVILSNTMGIHVPISPAANAEAARMLPSQNLYKPGSGKLQQKIEHEYVLGLFKISRPTSFSTRRYSSASAVLSDLNARKLAPDVGISVAGLGSTTAGRVLINESLPPKLRDYGQIWTDKTIQAKLTEVDKVSGRQAFVGVLRAWADIGRRYAYLTGSSFLLSDLQTMGAQRDDAFRRADAMADRIRLGPGTEAEKEKKIIAAYAQVSMDLQKAVNLKDNAAGRSNNVRDMMEAGARGDPGQIRQMISNVGVMLDHENKAMPEPVRGTYAEGLSSAEFFQHMYGNRKGMIDKSQSVKDPGFLTKQVVVSAAGLRVSMVDCGTTAGIAASTTGTEALDRYLAESVAGVGTPSTIVTSTVLSTARGRGVKELKVRSPLTCKAAAGICAKCHGLDEEGRLPAIGDHVGIKSAHALTEPSTQLALKQFHSGGAVTGKRDLTSGFDRVRELFLMPEEIRGQATLAEVGGRVDSLSAQPAGGWLLTVDGKKHRLARGRQPTVKIGDVVEKGQALSDGEPRPQDVLRLRGLRAMQMALRDDIAGVYAAGGSPLALKTIETPVRLLTSTVRVTDAGDHSHLVTGDYGQHAQIDAWNRENPTRDPVRYTHILPGADYLPHRTDDWAQRMAHNRIQQVLQEAPAMGASAPVQGGSPFAALLTEKKIERDPWSPGGLTNG